MGHNRFSKAAARLDAATEKALADKRIVGSVVLMAHDGEMIYRRAAGYSDREFRTAMREDAIFRLASITKPIVTAAFMRAVEEGRVDLDTPVTKWLPDFRPTLPDGSRPAITMHHLLTHTSGLGYAFLEEADGPYRALNISDALDQPGLSVEENLSRLAKAPLAFKPGSAWRYSLGMDVIGSVLEKIENRSLPEIVREKVLAPLGVKDTDFIVLDRARLVTPYADGTPEPVPLVDGMSVPYLGNPVTFVPSRIFDLKSYPSGGGGMAGTATDVLRFLEAIRSGGAPILKAQTIETMAADKLNGRAQTRAPGWGFGYGWAVLVDPQAAATPQAPGTLRWGGVYGHSWFVDRTNRLSVVALTNTTFEGMSGAFSIDIRDAVYD
jgi:CubicO group peptidase (beta-lactamase class C family)